MSKPARKHTPAKKLHKPHHEPAPASKFNIKSPVVAIIVTAVLVAIPFTLGKYFEFNQPDPYDSGGYVYSAYHILQGAKIGVDERPSAQVGTLLVNMLGVGLFGFNETGPKLIQTILQAAALLLMFIAMRKLFGTLAASFGVIVASVYLSSPAIAKFGNVKEQYMIAFMVAGMSCFVLYQLGDKWFWAILTGAFISWAPLFKETGYSAIGAVGLFVILQPILKHRSWKNTTTDILLLSAGVLLSIGPICLWLAGTKAPITYFPYSSLWRPITTVLQSPQDQSEREIAKSDTDEAAVKETSARQSFLMKFLPGYVRNSWRILKPAQKKQAMIRVLRWYRVLILPIALAAAAIVVRLIGLIMFRLKKPSHKSKIGCERFVLLFAVWWFLDMAFIWVSPRSYEQYYLPLNASAAMLGGYLIAIYSDKFKADAFKTKWIVTGLVGLLLMIIMSWHIFFGIEKSPHSGTSYGEKQRGYLQTFVLASGRRKGARGSWELVGEYIQTNSKPTDNIYVWGWFPGIYVAAQRLSPTPKAFEGTMHTLSPKTLSERVDEILSVFHEQPPKFIVDTHKRHFPWDRPPLELWPIMQNQILKATGKKITQPDQEYSKWLRGNVDDDEALRYEAMQPFRQFVTKNYKIVRAFGQHVLFERK